MPKRPAKRGSKKRKSSSNDGVILGAAIGGSVVVFLSLVLFIMTRSMWQAPAILDNLQQAAADATSSLDSATTDNATASVASGSSTFSDANRETVANRTTASTLNDRTTTPSTSPTSSQVSLDHLDPEVREALELMKQVNEEKQRLVLENSVLRQMLEVRSHLGAESIEFLQLSASPLFFFFSRPSRRTRKRETTKRRNRSPHFLPIGTSRTTPRRPPSTRTKQKTSVPSEAHAPLLDSFS